MMLKNTMLAALRTEDSTYDYCNNSQHGYSSSSKRGDYDRICRELRVHFFAPSEKCKENRVILWRQHEQVRQEGKQGPVSRQLAYILVDG